MAAAAAMEMHDRRLSTSKASAKIKKSPSPAPSSSAALSSSSSAAANRPAAKIVKADPSSFRRVVQELTGTSISSPSHSSSSSSSPSPLTTSPSPSSSSARTNSRLQRIAPPPLRADVRNIALLQQQQQQQEVNNYFLLQQQLQQGHLRHVQQQQQQSHLHQQQQQQQQSHLHQQQHQQQFSLAPPRPALLGPNPSTFVGSEPPSFTPRLPMLSPHLFSPLPALSPGDNHWAHPSDALPPFSPTSIPAARFNPPSPHHIPPFHPETTMFSFNPAAPHSADSLFQDAAHRPPLYLPADPQQGQVPPPSLQHPFSPAPAFPQQQILPFSPPAAAPPSPFAWPLPTWSPTPLLPLTPLSSSLLSPPPLPPINGASFSSPRDQFSFRGQYADSGMYRPS